MKTSFLHVGGFLGNDSDESRLVMAVADMMEVRGWPRGLGDHTYLDAGVDFLAMEIPKVDVLILHWIYSGPFPSTNRHSLFWNSPLHTKENWRKAILATGARLIYAYGGDDEIGGGWIGDLPGYRRDLIRVGMINSDKQVYIKSP